MVNTRIAGLCAKHAIVTPLCRANKGELALEEALERLRASYKSLVEYEANAGAEFHFVLTVSRP